MDCLFFTHSDRPLHRPIPLPARIDPNSGEAYHAAMMFRQTERTREINNLFLLQDILRIQNVPNAVLILILIFSYLNSDPELEKTYNLLEMRPVIGF